MSYYTDTNCVPVVYTTTTTTGTSDTWTITGAAIIAASGLYAFYRERVRTN